jgi:hypothetical protein
MSTALALDCRTLEKDATPAASLRVACAGCDPDNPRSVPRERCKKCRGTGLVVPEVTSIVDEMHAARLELLLSKNDRDFTE